MIFQSTVFAAFAAIATAQTPANCSTQNTGYLGVRPAANYADGQPENNIGTIPEVTAFGLDGHLDPIVVTQYKNGTQLPRQAWEFARCTNLDNHATPPGYVSPNGPTNLYFGIIRPQGNTYSCLSLNSTKYDTTGAMNTLLDARNCTSVPEKYRIFMLEEQIYGTTANGDRLFYADADDTTIIANTTHKEIVLTTNDNSDTDGTHQQLLLIPTTVPS